MECSLSTWPSITQFDDFSWAGLGDIDPLESLDQSFDNEPGTFFPDLQETKPSVPANTIPCSNNSAQSLHTQNGDLYRLNSSDSLVAARWNSINDFDLASVLDNTFPSSGDTSTPSAEDVYELYSGSILNDVDTFMADSISEVVEGNTIFHPDDSVSAVTPEVSSLSSSQDDVKCDCGAVDGDSTGSINISQVGASNPVVIKGDCNGHHADMFEDRGGLSVNMVQPLPFDPTRPPRCGDPYTSSHCAMDLKESVLPQRHDFVQPGLMMPWSKSQLTTANPLVFDGEKVVHPSNLHIWDNYPVIIDQQVRLATAATDELKRNRAQASRARRLAANQRRAKKYPLQKLIRMSSSPTRVRDRLEQNVSGTVAMLHQPMHMVSPSQVPGSSKSLPRSTLNSQVPSFLPVLQSPKLVPSHGLLAQPSPLRGTPCYCYKQTLATAAEDIRVTSGSGAMQSMCTDQDVQSLSSTPTPAFSNSTDSTQSLDAALLEQLQTILGKVFSVVGCFIIVNWVEPQMNVNTRLCIRDALYRLANNAKVRQSRNDTTSESSSSHSKAVMETITNSLDRWIVNILFCKQPTSLESNAQLHRPTLMQASNQFIDNFNTSNSQQQWNSCGSSANLEEQPLHVVSGL